MGHHGAQARPTSPLKLEAEGGNDDLDFQVDDDLEAPSDLGNEASNDLDDEAGDEVEDSAKEGADEATKVGKDDNDLGLDRHGNDSEDRAASTEDEL